MQRKDWEMSANPKSRDSILKQIERPKTRSALFWWLYDNHDRVLHAANGARISWRELCSSFADQGITDRDGKAPSIGTARLTWWRVRKERARMEVRRGAEEAAQAARRAADPRRNMPSRITGPVGPALAEVQTELPIGATLWNDDYFKDHEGWIQPVQQNIREYINLAGAARNRQDSNRSIGRPIDQGIENLIGPKKEYGA
jgi:hypothetical protein